MPIELTSLNRQPASEVEPVATLPTETAAAIPTTDTPKPQQKSKLHTRPHKNEEPAFINQSLGRFTGRLSVQEGQLSLVCPDAAILPVVGSDPKLALWLLCHPEAMQSEQDCEWLVYPRLAPDASLSVILKAQLKSDSQVQLEPDSALVKGRLLAIYDDYFIVGIRRNISAQSFSELQKKGMLGDEFQPIKVRVEGIAPGETGQDVEVWCQRQGERLVVK
jgi:hypothetical protein